MGTVVLSIDAELGWGWPDVASPPSRRIESARDSWRRIASLLDEFRLPATWAIVGHLLLDECDGYHADHPVGPEWFEHERGAWRSRDDLRFANGLLETVTDARVDHDVGCHTFSHVPFGLHDTTREVARVELEESLDAAADRGLCITSFVFPRNSIGHRDVLAEYGIEIYRGRQPKKWTDDTLPSPAVKTLRAALPGGTPPLVTPTIDEYGLVNLPASLFLYGFEGPAKTVAQSLYRDPIVVMAERGVDAAADSDDTFHMWLHPNNLITERDFERLRTVLRYVARRRDEGDVEVATMKTIARRTIGHG